MVALLGKALLSERQWLNMPVRDLLSAASGASGPATYVEDVFSTYLYAGNASTQTINNGIDLATYGGLVWGKNRTGAQIHELTNTVMGTSLPLYSNATYAAAAGGPSDVTSFNTNGYSLGYVSSYENSASNNYVSWTFRKQPKFFDVVTYTGDGSVRNIAHNLGSVPGFIITKRTDSTGNWWCYQKDLGNDNGIRLNATGSVNNDPDFWNSTTPTSTVFTLGTSTNTNASGGTYVAYLFADNAGGFGTAGTDNVISCGSYSGSSSDVTVSLGYEPQYILSKNVSSGGNWFVQDVMRGMSQTNDLNLRPNLADAESNPATPIFIPTATGFIVKAGIGAAFNSAGESYIYMAIRRPMKVPTTGTTVFKPTNQDDDLITTNFVVDAFIENSKNGNAFNSLVGARLIGNNSLTTSNTSVESVGNFSSTVFQSNTSYGPNFFGSGAGGVEYAFSRRPNFFDEFCYTGTGNSGTRFNHNLGVPPELMICKARSTASYGYAQNWFVYSSKVSGTPTNKLLILNTTDAITTNNYCWGFSPPTSTDVGIGADATDSGTTFVAYLFATCPGVSKVGSYTGNGGTQAIACGFTGGARFVLIKRTDSTGDWYVYDTARGMTTLTDPYLRLNSAAADTATLGSVTTTTGGFTVNASILAAINTSGASYIFLAIA